MKCDYCGGKLIDLGKYADGFNCYECFKCYKTTKR